MCFFKQKRSYERRISDWSSDVCSSDLAVFFAGLRAAVLRAGLRAVVFRFVVLRAAALRATFFAGLRAVVFRFTVLRVAGFRFARSDERRVGKECVSTCRYWWAQFHYKNYIIYVTINKTLNKVYT